MQAYNAKFVILIATIIIVLAVIVFFGLVDNKEMVKKAIGVKSADRCSKVNYFPKYVSSKAIICYIVTLVIVSALFMTRTLPFQFVVFGFVSVFVFFHFSNQLTMDWRKYAPRPFAKKLFVTALLIRLAYVIFSYFYFIKVTGEPYSFHAADEHFYHTTSARWSISGLDDFLWELNECVTLSDTGYCWWLAIEYKLLGTHVLTARVLKCFIDAFSCVLIYNLAERNFGEAAGRIAAVFYMLMPNAWFYCGITLKETEMTFLVILFVERGDMVLHSPKIKIKEMILPLLIIIVMFTFRTALAAVMFAAMIAGLVLTSEKQIEVWKKILYGAVFAVWMFFAVGVELVQETQQLWAGRTENQEMGYQWRAEREGGNTFAKYATASVFAPLIFTIPFSSMVYVEGQELQMMMNGANFIKNILSGFTILALFLLLFRRDWRQHVLPLAVMCGYLVVLVFSSFAHSERFHFPVLALELMFAAYGITQMTNRHKRLYMIWIVFICIASVLWALVKLRGRGLA